MLSTDTQTKPIAFPGSRTTPTASQMAGILQHSPETQVSQCVTKESHRGVDGHGSPPATYQTHNDTGTGKEG